VTDDDRAKKVTKHVIAQNPGHDDVKKKSSSSKYTLAVGSSFGHSKDLILLISLNILNLGSN